MMIWWLLRYSPDSQPSHLCGSSSSANPGNRLSNKIPTSSTYTTPIHKHAPPQLLTIIFDRTNTYGERRGCFDLLSADLDCDGGDGDVRKATIRSSAITLRSPSPNVKVVGPVRGLLCFADLANFDVMIYNVSTRQAITPWIRSSVSLEKLPFKEPRS
ncbi:hypothetical protein LINGRAHAP2_LOCUS36107 [Linum grandiflorum]